MDLKRLAVVLFQRLAPVYIATALSWMTGYFVLTLGGIGLAIATRAGLALAAAVLCSAV